MDLQATDSPLRLIHGADGPLIYDTNRVCTYHCSAAEAYLLKQGEIAPSAPHEESGIFDQDALTAARQRLTRLANLSQSLAGDAAIAEPDRNHPTYLLLHVCDSCNLRCSYCYAEGCHEGDQPSRMTADTAKASVDLLFDHCSRDDHCVVTFAGGEPLLNIGAVEAAVTHARRRQRERAGGLDLRILTNGTVMSQRILQLISEQEIFLQISLDGPPEVHDQLRFTRQGKGSSAKILETIEFLEQNGFSRFRVRATLSRHNANVGKIAEFYSSRGIRDFSIQPVMCGSGEPFRLEDAEIASIAAYYRDLAAAVPTSSTEREQPALSGDIQALLAKLTIGLKTKRHCGAGTDMLVVTPPGELYPCPALVGHARYRIGDMHGGNTESFQGAFCNLPVDAKSGCQACWARNLCGGGCAAQAIRINGDIEQPDPQECALTKSRIEAAIAIHHRLSG